MWGFGNPDFFGLPRQATAPGDPPGSGGVVPTNAATQYTRGFGRPDPNPWLGDTQDPDWGFGDPAPQDLIVAQILDGRLLPDTGGEVIRVRAVWPVAGPYYVRLTDSFSGEIFPDVASQFACNALLNVDRYLRVIGRTDPYACYTSTTAFPRFESPKVPPVPGPFLFFVLPPVPPGVYDVNIFWGETLQYTIDIERALEVTNRSGSDETYLVRSLWPPKHRTGPRTSLQQAPLTTPEEDIQ